MIMTKKLYIAPAIEVINMEAENMLALSVQTGNGTKNASYALSNKREPAVSTWSSSNWGTEE